MPYYYSEPGESGQRTDVRWATFTDRWGNGLKVTGFPVIEINATPYRMKDIEGPAHPYEVPEHKKPRRIAIDGVEPTQIVDAEAETGTAREAA